MSETYCGKNCEECTYKEPLNCSGCIGGPGNLQSGDCKIAACCREKKHSDCETCTSKGYCGMLHDCLSIPKYRIEKLEKERIYMEEKEKKAQFLGKWLWLLFWLVIPSTLGGILTQENVVSWIPAVKMPGVILNTGTAIVYSLILIKISTQSMSYRTAGISKLLALACTTIAGFISGNGWKMLLLLPGLIMALVGTYFEYTSHSGVVSEFDSEISAKWDSLWKWYLRTVIGMFGGIALMLLIPILGIVLYLAATIGQVVVAIWQLVCLYQTASVIRKWKVTEE